MVSLDIVSAIIFYAIVLFFVYRNRDKFERQLGIMFLYRSKKGLKLIERVGQKIAPLIIALATIGIVVSFYFMIVIVKTFLDGVIEIIKPTDAPAQFGLIIPGIHIPGSPVFVPFWYGIISLVILVFVHEIGHALAAAAQKIKLKHDGFGFLLFIPLFFVEPDEKEMKNARGIERMRVAAAGPFANIALAFLITISLGYVLIPAASGLVELNGVELVSVKDGLPAANAGLSSGMIVSSVNGTQTQNMSAFISALEGAKPGDTIVLGAVSGEEFVVSAGQNPDNASQAYLGVTFQQSSTISAGAKERFGFLPQIVLMFLTLLNWVAFLNFGVGVINLVPIWVLDGGHILFDTLRYVLPEKKAVKIAGALFSTVLFLFLFNLFAPLVF